MRAAGFSMIELLVATALVLAIGGALAALVAPARGLILRAQAAEDLEGGVRVALQRLAADAREAGNGPAIAAPALELARVLATVQPLVDLGGAPANPGAALRLVSVPHLAAQGVLAGDAASGDTVLRLDTTTRCATGPPACGFSPGQQAVIYSTSAAAAVAVNSVAPGMVLLDSPLGAPFAAGALLTVADTVTYGTRSAADGSLRLVWTTGGGAEQPLLDHVVAFEAALDDNDPAAASRVSLTLRVQAPSPVLRGPAGYLFRVGGTATDARRWLPDVEHRVHVALRVRSW